MGVPLAFHPSQGLIGSVVKIDRSYYVRTRFGHVSVTADVGAALQQYEKGVVRLARAVRRSLYVAAASFVLGALGGALLS